MKIFFTVGISITVYTPFYKRNVLWTLILLATAIAKERKLFAPCLLYEYPPGFIRYTISHALLKSY